MTILRSLSRFFAALSKKKFAALYTCIFFCLVQPPSSYVSYLLSQRSCPHSLRVAFRLPVAAASAYRPSSLKSTHKYSQLQGFLTNSRAVTIKPIIILICQTNDKCLRIQKVTFACSRRSNCVTVSSCTMQLIDAYCLVICCIYVRYATTKYAFCAYENNNDVFLGLAGLDMG